MVLEVTDPLDSIYSTTFAIRLKGIVDNIHNSTPFYFIMTQNGRMKKFTGGRRIEIPLTFEKNTTIKGLARRATVILEDTDNITTALYDWKYIFGHIEQIFQDFQKNRGASAVESKVNADIDSLIAGFITKLEDDLFLDGTGDGGNTIDGLQLLVADDPTTGIVGGIDRSITPGSDFWRNQTFDFVTTTNVSIRLVPEMRKMYNNTGKFGSGKERFIDMIITAQDIYEAYEEEAVETIQHIMPNAKLADLGFGELMFKGKPITWSPSAPAGKMYFLNSNFLWKALDSEFVLKLLPFIPLETRPGDKVAHAVHTCNLVTSHSAKQGVIFNITP